MEEYQTRNWQKTGHIRNNNTDTYQTPDRSRSDKIVAVRNRAKLGSETNGNIKIEADTKKAEYIGSELSRINELWYVAQLAGDADFDAEFSVESQHDLLILLDKINKIDGVIRTRTSTRLKLVKQLGEFVTFTNPSAQASGKG